MGSIAGTDAGLFLMPAFSAWFMPANIKIGEGR